MFINGKKFLDPNTLIYTDLSIYNIIKMPIVHILTKVYVISYPKSGRTWLRMLMAYYFGSKYNVEVNPEIIDQWKRNFKVPLVRFTHAGVDYRDREEEKINFSRYRSKKVIFLLRSPIDVVVSYFYHINKRWQDPPEHLKDISRFIRDNDYGIPRVVSFMNLILDEVKQNKQNKYFVVTYEQMHANINIAFSNVMRFILDAEPDTNLIQKAIEECQFDRMKKKEYEGVFKHDAMLPGDLNDPDSFKVREGKVGGGMKRLTAEDQEYVNSYIDQYLSPYFAKYSVNIS